MKIIINPDELKFMKSEKESETRKNFDLTPPLAYRLPRVNKSERDARDEKKNLMLFNVCCFYYIYSLGRRQRDTNELTFRLAIKVKSANLLAVSGDRAHENDVSERGSEVVKRFPQVHCNRNIKYKLRAEDIGLLHLHAKIYYF